MHNDLAHLGYNIAAALSAIGAFLALRYGFAGDAKDQAARSAWEETGVKINKAHKK